MVGNAIIKKDDIQSRIYTIRGVQVMLDKDFAIFYGVRPFDGIAKCDTIKTVPGRHTGSARICRKCI